MLENLTPSVFGGGIVENVDLASATWKGIPERFEAGTPNVAGAVGLASAIDYLEQLGMEAVREHDKEIVGYSLELLAQLPNIKILGTHDKSTRSGSVSFEYMGVHAHDAATILDSEGVAVRSGHHCTMPLHNHLGVVASIRASFNVYTTKEDIDTLVTALGKIKTIFGK